MIKIINFYIFRQLALTTVFITAVLSLILGLSQSLKYIDIVLNRGFPISLFFKIIFFLLPDLISVVLPITSLIAVLYTYNRFSSDKEIIVLRSAGFSNLDLSLPAFFFGGLVTLFLYGLNLYFLPLSFHSLNSVKYHIRNNITSQIISPGEFTTFNKITLYAEQRKLNGELKNIVIHDSRTTSEPFTLIAEHGLVVEKPKGVSIVMLNGNRQKIDLKTGKLNLLSFNSYTVDLFFNHDIKQEYSQKPYEQNIQTLLNPNLSMLSPVMARKYIIEAHKRLSIPLTVLCFIGIALAFLLTGDYNRRGQSKKISLVIGLTLFFQLLFLVLFNLSERFQFSIFLIYLSIIICLLCSFITLVSKNNKKFDKKS